MNRIPSPVKRAEKNIRISQHGTYAMLGQPEIRAVCYAGNPNFRFLFGKTKFAL